MHSSPLFRTLLVGLLMCIGCSGWGWPPSEEDKTRWLNLIWQGRTDLLRQQVEALRVQGEDIGQWVNFNLGFHYRSFLSQAAQYGHIPIAQLLIDNGAEVNAEGYGFTPVHMAVQNNHPEMLDFLLGQGAKVDGENDSTETPLTQAIKAGHIGMVESLLRHGASVHPRREHGPLIAAALAGNTRIIGILLDKGASPDGHHEVGYTRPLEMAAARGHIEAVRQLINAGARINLQNYLEETALHEASEHGHLHIAEFLLDHGANVEGEDPEAVPLTRQEIIDRGYVRGSRMENAIDNNERFVDGSPLNRAAGNGHIDIVKLLLRYGADVSNVRADSRAALQQLYPPESGIEAAFNQYKAQTFDVITGPFTKKDFSTWLNEQFKNVGINFEPETPRASLPLINQAVLLTTLELPDVGSGANLIFCNCLLKYGVRRIHNSAI